MKIIFDLDGTLYQTQSSLVFALNLLCEELNYSKLDEEMIVCHIGKKTDDFLNAIFPCAINHDNIKARLKILEHQAIECSGRLFSGVKTMLLNLKNRGHKLFICSNGSREYIEHVLRSTGISNYFDSIESAKFYPSKSEALLEIMKEEKYAIFVGDTIIDFEAGANIKIPTIGFTGGYGSTNDLEKATYLARSAQEIVNLIAQIDIYFKSAKRTVEGENARVIGINGVDTSGKTFFTYNFSKFLTSVGIKNMIIHIDDFHNPSEIRSKGKSEIEAYYNNAFNYKQLIDEILEPLKDKGEIDKIVCCLNLDTNEYENFIKYRIDKDCVVLIEGVLLFREPLINYFNRKIFIQIDFDEVIRRAKIRDVPKYGESFIMKYINKYIPIQQKYMLEHKPRECSDLVILNNDYNNPILT